MNIKTATNIAIEVENLSIGYGSMSICSNINFKLLKSEIVGIIGGNGIGKSTLLRTVGNFQPRISGEIKIDGVPLDNYKSEELAKKVSVVLTEPLSSKNMSVIELLALGRQPYTNWIGKLKNSDISKINEVVQLLELSKLKNKKCFELSDGQLQRVLIGRALVQDTDIILLDEPTTHLDLYHKIQILKLLRSIAHITEKTILFTSHEIDLAIQLCDKMLILNSTENYFDQPCNLISENRFHSLFPDDTVSFDKNTGTFRIKK